MTDAGDALEAVVSSFLCWREGDPHDRVSFRTLEISCCEALAAHRSELVDMLVSRLAEDSRELGFLRGPWFWDLWWESFTLPLLLVDRDLGRLARLSHELAMSTNSRSVMSVSGPFDMRWTTEEADRDYVQSGSVVFVFEPGDGGRFVKAVAEARQRQCKREARPLSTILAVCGERGHSLEKSYPWLDPGVRSYFLARFPFEFDLAELQSRLVVLPSTEESLTKSVLELTSQSCPTLPWWAFEAIQVGSCPFGSRARRV